MPRSFSFKLQLLFNEQLDDNAGNWQYAAADASEQTTGETAQLIATKRTNACKGFAFPASALTAVIMFSSQPGEVAPNMTLQGVHDLTTNNETGSVSAASSELADQIGGTFSYDHATDTLTVLPPGAAYASPLAAAARHVPLRAEVESTG
jgi:phage baseplate assembly protein gpV